jgi:ABC-type transport system involved in cytochrome c biogenesis permease subunit
MIHVAIITGSYAPLGLSALLGLINLILYISRGTKRNEIVTLNINEITYVSEMAMTIGLFMLTIGTFLGGVWANESWGRYWGWDAKETWALVSVLVYAIILHLRYIPGLKSKFTFNMVSLWGFSSILFTFFGVNFVLGGLHSYAQGDSILKFPEWLVFIILGFAAFSAVAVFVNYQYNKRMKAELEREF